MEEKEDIVNRIKEIIKRKGLSISQFATQANIDQSNLSSILNHKRPLGSGVISKIALAYDINMEWLTTGEGDMYRNFISATSGNLVSEPTADYIANVISKDKYILSLEDEIKVLKRTVDEQSQIIQGFLNGTITTISKSEK